LRMTLGPPAAPSRELGAQCRAFTGAAVGINIFVLGLTGLHVPPGLGKLLVAITKIFTIEMEVP
jgi:hypothetical protein